MATCLKVSLDISPMVKALLPLAKVRGLVRPGQLYKAGPMPSFWPRWRFFIRTKPLARPRARPWALTEVLVFQRTSAVPEEFIQLNQRTRHSATNHSRSLIGLCFCADGVVCKRLPDIGIVKRGRFNSDLVRSMLDLSNVTVILWFKFPT